MSSKAKHSQNGLHNMHTVTPPASTLVELSPPSTPSRLSRSSVPPFYSSSPSNASSPMYPTPSKPQTFGEENDSGGGQLAPQKNSTPFGMSSTRACVPSPTTPDVSIATASLDSVSLEQHRQLSDIGREEAMQSFILDRFLPAAKAVATDHDHALYTTSKHQPMKPSTTSNMSTPRSVRSASRLYSIPSTFSPSKGVKWSSPLSQDEGEMESYDYVEPSKCSGFFCVGLKTAISRVHKVVHPSAHSMSRSKNRAAMLYGDEASYEEEEDVLPKVNVLRQGMQRRRNADTTASYTFSPSSSTVETIHRRQLSSYTLSPKNSLPRNGHVGEDGNPFARRASFDATRLHNMISPSIQQLRCDWSKQSSWQGNAWQNSSSPLQCEQSCANNAENASGGSRLEDYHSHNTSRCTANDNAFTQIPAADRENSKGSTAHRDALDNEAAMSDPEFAEDEEHEFYDAFDSWSSIPGDDTSSPLSPKVSGSSRKCTSDEDGVVDAPNHTKVVNLSCKTTGYHAKHENSKYFPENPSYGGGSASSAHIEQVKQKQEKPQADHRMETVSRTPNSSFSPKPRSASYSFDSQFQSSTPNGHQKWLSSPRPGWPLGISGFQSGAEKSLFQDQAKQDDTNSVSAYTESNVSSPRIPPSPTGSWLERAMAFNASKPSTLATLQRKENAASARKKLEFTLSDARKDVKWEDVVKGSQMHPEHIRLSEELRHRPPIKRNVIKPLGL